MQLTGKFSQYASDPDRFLIHAIETSDTPKLAFIFKQWDKNPPSVMVVTELVITGLQQQLPVDFSSEDLSLMRTAAGLAAEENKNPYHGNLHFLKVFTLSAFLGTHAYQKQRMTQHDLALLLTAALIHDYKHDGTNNNGQKYRLEDISLDAAEKSLEPYRTEEDWQLIKAFVRTTDVSKNFADPLSLSPSDSVKKYSLTRNADDLLPELRILADKNNFDIALMLEDADLGGGLLDKQLNKTSGISIAKEQHRAYDFQREKFFLEQICHRRLFSVSGQILIQPSMDKILTSFRLPISQDKISVFAIK